jgi:maltooligosyltrehalose trehalohydrolase
MLKPPVISYGSPVTVRRLPIGAEPCAEGTRFRVWAPQSHKVEVCIEGAGDSSLSNEGNGYFCGLVAGIAPGACYRFRLDAKDALYPDPASRFQPHGPHGPSEIADSNTFVWSDGTWPGIRLAGQVLYEMHVGTFTPEGTWASAQLHLAQLRDIGITCIEMMPLAEFPGEFGWGYDGVDWFAPSHLYGRPDDLRRFINHAHALGLGVILDVVYNHFGPDGCFLREFATDYFTSRHKNEWGEALNFDGDNASGMRELVTANVRYWIEEFHFDGLRLDATQTIQDNSETHILQDISQAAHEAAGARQIVLIAENEEQKARLVRPQQRGGYGLDAMWNDDFHHSAMVALTGHNPAYYSGHLGVPQEFVSAAKYGFLYQGQHYAWQDQPRGSPSLDLDPAQFVLFLENHDQVANSARGLRMHQLTDAGRARAFTALFLLLPGTPMLFQGQEFWCSEPFLYFADHKEGLNEAVEKGRREFLSQFPHLRSLDLQISSPGAFETFLRCKLDWTQFHRNAGPVALHRDLLALRREDAVFRAQRRHRLDGAVLGDEAFVLRFFGKSGDDRLLIVNYGRDLKPACLAEPLLAPSADCRWSMIWSSEDPKYGGSGISPFETQNGLHIPGHAALVLASRPSQPNT